MVELFDRQPLTPQDVEQHARVQAPLRVPMTSPSSGVKPMEVSMQMPLRTADTDAPLPKWAMTSREAL